MGRRSLAAGYAALTASIVLAGAGAAVPSVTASAGAGPGHRVASGAVPGPRLRKTAAAVSTPTRVPAPAAATVSTVARVSAVPQTPIHEGICTGPPGYRSLEARLSADIKSALRDRAGDHAVTVYDRVTSVYCTLRGGRHFDSASVVKVIILAALLRWHQETRTPLSAREKSLATKMITVSDNDAATDLWNELGMSRLQHLLNLAQMNETELGHDGYWGFTQVTSHDEMLLLELLTAGNVVLSSSSRSYELGLMAKVVAYEAWGVTTGTPSGVTWHVKNGWLPDADDEWHINSIGAFTGRDKDYMIAVLTDDDPSEQYGIDTIENVARPVNWDLNAVRPAAVLPAAEPGAVEQSTVDQSAVEPAAGSATAG